jgi:flagellar hook-associated protein 1 FlgK
MSSLNTALSIASEGLSASTTALQTVTNNMANANTPGYTREVVEFQSLPADNNGSPGPGTGVTIAGIQSVRDELLQRQIEQQTQQQSSANAQLTSMQQIQPAFTTSSQDIGTEMTALFSSISSLSTNPTSSTDGQAVLTAGQNLADAFNTTSETLTQQQSGLNAQVTQDVSQINQLTQQISALNPQIAALQSQGQDGGTLHDQQDQLVLQLSQLTGVTVTNTNDGITLSTGNGTPLVSGAQSFALQTTTGSGGMVQVLDANGNNITSTLTGGDLGGSIQTRDQAIPGLLNQLDNLAYNFANAFNSAQAQGFDQNGNPGGDFFSVPATASGAAAAIGIAITNPSLIASSSDGTSGSNGNLANLSAIQTTPLASSGQTPTDAYASLVYQVGTLTANANAESNATTSSLLQLNNQLNSVSGVSIDEESTNLISYQQSYEAAARVVTTVQALYQVLMTMGTAAAE